MPVPTTTMRIDEDAKSAAKPILEELGLNISSATNMFLKAVVRCNGLPFELRLPERVLPAPEEDFVASYLAPIMSGRNYRMRAGFEPAAFRRRLAKRNEAINRGRRSIA